MKDDAGQRPRGYGAAMEEDHGPGQILLPTTSGGHRQRRARSRGWRLLTGALALPVAVAAGSLAVGQVLIHPSAHRVGPPPEDLAAHEVVVPVAGRPGLRGWLAPGRPGLGAVLLVHGLRSDRRSMVPRARFLRGLGYTVLLVDLQAHGESPGRHITFGRLESDDVRAAVGFLRSTVDDGPVAVIGVSLGAAAIVLADPAAPVQAIVLESMYAAFDTAVDNRMRVHLGPAGPALSGLLVSQLPLRLGISDDDLRPVDRIGRLHVPVLICAGDQDRHATADETRALFAAAAEPKALWLVPGAGHVDLYDADPAGYRSRIGPFLELYLPRRP